MKQSQFFNETMKEAPKEAEAVSHQLLTRADFIDQLASGIYSFLPLGFRVQKKIENIIRKELESIGAQEVLMPALQPKSLWEKTGRWSTIDPPLFAFKDRHQKDLALGSTHEEVITQLVAKRIRTFKDLPQALFQIQDKFRNEMRSTGGLLRTREFLMKDLYSFHADKEDFEKYYELAKEVYLKIYKKCGLDVLVVEASGAGFTKDFTHEFQVLTPAGEDTVIFCEKKHFAQNKEIAKLKEGDKCPVCNGKLESGRAVEVGNIFPLGTKYSEALGANFTDKDGVKKPIIMGCYGIGLGRLMATIVEVHHDEKGIVWPIQVSPFDVHLLVLGDYGKGSKPDIKGPADAIYQDLQKSGIEVLYDEREGKTAGEKFADSDLIGISLRVVVSERTLEKSCVEVKKRSEKESELVKIGDLADFINKNSTD